MVLSVALFLLQAAAGPAQWFEETIRPLLAARCLGCHGDARVSGLRLDSREGVLKGGRRGPAAVAGDGAASLLVRAVRRDGELKMPPNEPLSPQEIAVLEKWIAVGLPYPEAAVKRVGGKITEADRNWWAFRPLPKPVASAGAIDGFVGARLAREGIQPLGPAPRAVLVRRLFYDLTGLPPAAEDFERFDRRPDVAAETDRLLASPRFGERWGRHWLDIARYAEDDWRGLGQEKYANAWRYRDWVVDALNRDLPYDVFVKAQLAGDQITDREGFDLRPALGLLGLGPWQYSNSPPPQARADERHERVDMVSRGFLGLTVACARCHDHKFDPIGMADYYALAGVFASTEYREYPLAPAAEVERYESHQQLIRDKEKQIAAFVAARQGEAAAALAAQSARYIEAVRRGERGDLPETLYSRWKSYLELPQRDQPLLDGWRQEDPAELQALILSVLAERNEIEEARKLAVERTKPKAGAAKTRLPNGFETYDEFCPGCDVVVRAQPRDRSVLWQELHREPSKDRGPGVLFIPEKELDEFLTAESRDKLAALRRELAELKSRSPRPYPYLHGVADKAQPSNIRIALRGDPYQLGAVAPRRFLEVLGSAEPELWTAGSGRLQLAEAIVKQPLTARVAANRVWMNLMGRGIVGSPSNFGRLGERPTHPELLDYLAARLVEQRWSIKSLIREIVLSAAYQRASGRSVRAEAVDAPNKLYWRANRRRLDAEALRDSLLHAAGALDGRVGGESEELGAEFRRRTLYGKVSRFKLNEALALFDFPNPSATSERRVVTHVPLQRLYFLNNEFVARQAAALAARLTGPDPVGQAYRLIFGRPPSPEERRLGEEFTRTGQWTQYAHTLLSSNEFLFVD